MNIEKLHNFKLDFAQAKAIQIQLAKKLVIEDGVEMSKLETIAGCDVAFDKKSNTAFGAVVLLSYPELEVFRTITGTAPIRFPYVPGYLSFRELEVLVSLFEAIDERLDLVLVDGQGIAHPRGIGLASHLGLFLGIPTIGCAKSRLVGEHEGIGPHKGGAVPIFYDSKCVGMLLRTRDNVKPMYISPGHLISIESAADLALACTTRFRMPEPTRQAHIAVTKYKRSCMQ